MDLDKIFEIESGAGSAVEFRKLADWIGDRFLLQEFEQEAFHFIRRLFDEPRTLSKNGGDDLVQEIYIHSAEIPKDKLLALQGIAIDNFKLYSNPDLAAQISDWLARYPNPGASLDNIRKLSKQADDSIRDSVIFAVQVFLMNVGKDSDYWKDATDILDSLRQE